MLRRTVLAKVLLLLLLAGVGSGLTAFAQAPEPQSPAQNQSATTSPSDTTDDKSGTTRPEPLSLSDQVIRDVLEPLRLGIEGQNLQQVMSAFDKQTPNYAGLQDQLRAFFQMYSQIRFRYQILQAIAGKGSGSVTAEMEMDALPYEVTVTPERRSVQMRLKMTLTAKGWKIVAFTPANFFNATLSPGALLQ